MLHAIDAAVRADLRRFRIIHDKGTGALRERVSEMPIEGAALGWAILESLTARDAMTLATTHLGTLKELASTLELSCKEFK